MSIVAIDRKLNEFLSPNENIKYTIPTYQREYSWRKDHCIDLMDDIHENEINYFIGSIIWVEDSERGVNEIIDGQQRLTSISLLLIALFKKFEEFNNDDDIIFKRECIKRMIVSNESNRLVPQRQGKNKDDFEYLISTEILHNETAQPLNFGNRRICVNYKWFKDNINDLSKNSLLELYEKICNLTFISVRVDTQQMAFTLFETMNNRGMPLSAIDLIKSSYLSKTRNENSITDWENLINILGNENNQEQFLRNNYNAFRSEYNNLTLPLAENPSYPISSKATKSNVIKIYNTLVERENFMRFITLNAQNNSLLTGEENVQIDASERIKDIFRQFRNANATSAFTLLLFLLRRKEPFRFDDNQMCRLFELTLKFFVRRNITNIPSTGALPQIIMDIIEKINQLHEVSFDVVYNILLDAYCSKTSSDETIRDVLNGDVYDTNRDMTRYLLCSLCDTAINNERRMVDLWEKRDNKYIWTIEHILPEGNRDASNTPRHWIDMIKNGDESFRDYDDGSIIELVRTHRHKIGNLTMTGFNSSLGNKSFSEKKNRFDSNHNPIGYNNGLSLNEYVYRQDNWYIRNILERSNDLVEEIMNTLLLR